MTKVRGSEGRVRDARRDGHVVSWADISFFTVPTDKRFEVYLHVTTIITCRKISPLLPAPTTPFLLYESNQIVDCELDMRYMTNNVLENEILDITLGAWLSTVQRGQVVHGLRVSRSGGSLLTCRPKDVAIMFPL